MSNKKNESAVASSLGTGVLLASGTSIANTLVYAATDGFAVVQIGMPSDVSQMSNAWGEIYTIGTWFLTLGGSVGTFGSAWSDTMVDNPTSMCIPIQGGTNWQYYGTNDGNNQQDSAISIYWFPMGGSSAEETYRIVPKEEAKLVAPLKRNSKKVQGK
jgi:hypothetical protein